MSPLEEQLRERIAQSGPISVADYMAACNAHYYASRDPLGAGGDFITAPEISQMFGELAGAWLADLWARARRPADAVYVELGPGRGTLAFDALRVMAKAGLTPPAHLVETSPALRAAQCERLPEATWHDDVSTLPEDGPLLVVANEFFDALPIEQFGFDGRALTIGLADDGFVRPGLVAREVSPVSIVIAADLARRIAAQGGAALIVDYGYAGPSGGDTLQALSRHAFADPWMKPGEHDLTAHVGFAALVEAGRGSGARVLGPVSQGQWLDALGIGARAAALARATPPRAAEIETARRRLTGPDQMGDLFKVMAFVSRDWPEPAGFES
jgi:NADH dehydrogenase [ubiquinone] 1 alpha subcomplex assembly factor 7